MKKRIGIVHITGNIGGASISCYNMAISLKRKYEVVVFCPKEPIDFTDFLQKKGITVINYETPLGGIYYYSGGPVIISPEFIKKIYQVYKYKNSIYKQIKKENLDLLISNSKVSAWVSVLTKALNIPSVCFVRETYKATKYNIWNYIDRRYLEKFDLVSFISKYDHSRYSLNNNTVVIPNYLDISNYSIKDSREDLCKEFGVSSNSFNILYVGGMAWIKGIDVIIKAMKYLEEYDVKLIIAGRSEFIYKKSKNPVKLIKNIFKKRYELKINREIKKYNSEKRLVRIGIQNDMSSVYAISDVLVFPANKAHQARPAFEAGAMKLPVIIADFENIKEYVIDGYNGLYFEKRNPKSLASKIIKLIENQDLRQKMGEGNYKNTIEKHVRSKSEKILFNTISDLLGE